MRGGWGLDAPGKFFRRRRRRRRRRRHPPGFGIGFYYEIGSSRVRGSIRRVFRVPLEQELRQVVKSKKPSTKKKLPKWA